MTEKRKTTLGYAGANPLKQPGGRHHLPDAVYLPRLKQVPWLYYGTPEGRAWVEMWRELHLKACPFTEGLRSGIVAAVATIYRNADYPIPDRVYFEFGENRFFERVLAEKSNQFEYTWSTVESVLDRIEKEDDFLNRDLLAQPMAQLERQIAKALGRESAPSSRELFGEDGADLSAKGIRMDPAIEAVNQSCEMMMKGIAEKAEGWLLKPKKAKIPLLHLHDQPTLSREQIYLIMRMAQRARVRRVGNLSTGLFRQFAFLQGSLGKTVDFSSFAPWRYLVENVQHLHFGFDHVVITPIPSQVKISKSAFVRKWLGELNPDRTCTTSAGWPSIFGGNQET